MIWVLGLWLCGLSAAAQDSSGLARLTAGAIEDRAFGGTVLTLELSQGVPWRVFTLDAPRRVVLDFREVDWQGADPAAIDRSDAVTALRMGAFRPGWSRMVLALAEPMRIESAGLAGNTETGAATLTLQLQDSDAARFAASAGAPPGAGWHATDGATQTYVPPVEDGMLLVMLDPGHGGIDPGAERGGINEADLMLQFARELRDVLRRTGQIEVAMTRDSDHFVSLEARVAAAHDAGADIFLSLHADAIEQGTAHGASVYTLAEEASDAASAALAERHNRDDLLSGVDLSGADDRVAQVLMDLARLDNTPRSVALAEHVIGGIRNALGHVHKRPIRQASFSVLKAADIPSVLVELGFLSTETDLRNLQDPAWRAGMAAGIRDGLLSWSIEDEALSRLRRQ